MANEIMKFIKGMRPATYIESAVVIAGICGVIYGNIVSSNISALYPLERVKEIKYTLTQYQGSEMGDITSPRERSWLEERIKKIEFLEKEKSELTEREDYKEQDIKNRQGTNLAYLSFFVSLLGVGSFGIRWADKHDKKYGNPLYSSWSGGV